MRTLDVLEYLYRCESPVKTNEISDSLQVPRSTTYRILRTLVHRGYVLQDLDGRFSFNHPGMKFAPNRRRFIRRSISKRRPAHWIDGKPLTRNQQLSTHRRVDALLNTIYPHFTSVVFESDRVVITVRLTLVRCRVLKRMEQRQGLPRVGALARLHRMDRAEHLVLARSCALR
jgi:hypothetical protein